MRTIHVLLGSETVPLPKRSLAQRDRDLCHDFRMAQRHVKLTGDVEGSYVIEESLADGRFVVAPEWPSKETSVEAILERAGGERMSPEEFDKHFGHLPTDGEG